MLAGCPVATVVQVLLLTAVYAPGGVGEHARDYGAKGDGITDDTAAIQSALNAAANGSRIVHQREPRR